MDSVKVLHMADMHLEWPFAGMEIDGNRGRLRREELKAVFAAIIDLALAERVQVLLVAGDLFEQAHATRGLIQFIDNQFRRISDTRVFISPGNHDPYIAESYYQAYPWAPNVHIFGPETERVDLPDLAVSVYGWGFPAWEVRESAVGSLRVADPARINLLVLHGGDEAYHPFRPEELAATGADYVALGHIHKRGVVLEVGGRLFAQYCGSPEALSFGEPGEHGVFVGSVSKAGAELDFVPTGRRRYITREVLVDGSVSLEDLVDAILLVDAAQERRQHCYRLILRGTVDPELKVDLPILHEKLQGEFYVLRLEDQSSPDYDLDRLSEERSARGLFVQRLLALQAGEADPARAQTIRRALAMGLEAFGGKGGAR